MTGFDSKRQMAQAKLNDDDDDTQVYADTLLIVYQRGFADGKAAQQQAEPCIGKDPRCPCQDGDACHYKDCGNTKARPVAQPEQEPVAWGVFEGNLHDMFFTQEEAQEMAKLKGTHAEVRPLYTTPPAVQRTWVGLDEDDIRKLYGKDLNYRDGNYVRYAMAVEAKLKERNT